MIRHIVLFRLAATDDTERAAAVTGIRHRLSALVEVIPGLRSVSVGADLGLIDGHWDVALVSEHDSNDALEAYQAHPAHREAGAWIATVVTDRAIVDHEL